MKYRYYRKPTTTKALQTAKRKTVPVISGLEDRLIRDGKAVDELFTMVADQLFGIKELVS